MNRIKLENKTILVTGAAGFIGANLVMRLFRIGAPMTIVGLDNMNAYYDVSLKEYRLSEIERLAADRLAAIGAPGRWDRVAAVASVDLKRREYGLALFAARIRAPFVVYSAAELAAVEGDFSESSFVREVVGVANVCERSAFCASRRSVSASVFRGRRRI